MSKQKKKKYKPRRGFSKNLKNNKEIILLCAKLKHPIFKKFIKHVDNNFIKAISEICDNTIKGNVPLSKHHFSQLKRYYKHLKVISDKKRPPALKKKYIQTGGFLPTLIAPLIGFLGSIISSAIANRKKKK